MLKTLLVTGKWANLAVMVAQVANDATNYFPALANNHWFLLFQGVLAAFLPTVSKTIHDLAATPSK